MGTYLSTPVLDKCEETGNDLPLNNNTRSVNWGVVDMQGWRKSMEDAHVARTDVVPPGAEAEAGGGASGSGSGSGSASSGSPSEGGSGENSDENAPDIAAAESGESQPGPIPSVPTNATDGAGPPLPNPAKVFAVFDGHGGPEVARFCQLYLVDVLTKQKEWAEAQSGSDGGEGSHAASTTSTTNGTSNHRGANIGQALIESFHALDRMIDDPSRRDELTLLRSEKPMPGEYRNVLADGSDIPEKVGGGTAQGSVGAGETGGSLVDQASDTSEDEEEDVFQECCEEEAVVVEEKEKGGAEETKEQSSSSADADAESARPSSQEDAAAAAGSATDASDDADSTASIGGGDSIVNDGLDDDLDNDGDQEDEDGAGDDGEEGVISTADAMALFQKLLTMSGSSDQVEVEIEGAEGAEEEQGQSPGAAPAGADSAAGVGADAAQPVMVASDDGSGTPSAPAAAASGPCVTQPTRIQNGRQVCNLPDHPIHAGCTSVVAVLVGNTITVANAGDSRAVLCRAGGITEALSFDHKPLQDRERNRIVAAGGFVNQFGRVNGNLNLSRSIGDMKYKKVPGIPPSGQMITAEPDIVQVTLNPDDEFLILGCDGIWDCLTNEEAVKYVRDRIDAKTPIEIGREMLDEIISDDPRASQGIGGDNMTVMIVDLQPKSRPYLQ